MRGFCSVRGDREEKARIGARRAAWEEREVCVCFKMRYRAPAPWRSPIATILPGAVTLVGGGVHAGVSEMGEAPTSAL